MGDLSKRVVEVALQYLGPAAPVFLERQTMRHMNCLHIGDLEPMHLQDLQRWVRISASLVIDKTKAVELSERIGNLKV